MDKYYQQGDVLMKAVSEIPGAARELAPRDGLFVLAYGEVTGHKHAIQAIEGVSMFESEGRIFVRVSTPAVLRHEEHGAITLPPGLYERGIVKEYDHFAEESREVKD